MLLPSLLLSLASQLGTLINQQRDAASTASGLPGPQALQQRVGGVGAAGAFATYGVVREVQLQAGD